MCAASLWIHNLQNKHDFLLVSQVTWEHLHTKWLFECQDPEPSIQKDLHKRRRHHKCSRRPEAKTDFDHAITGSLMWWDGYISDTVIKWYSDMVITFGSCQNTVKPYWNSDLWFFIFTLLQDLGRPQDTWMSCKMPTWGICQTWHISSFTSTLYPNLTPPTEGQHGESAVFGGHNQATASK